MSALTGFINQHFNMSMPDIRITDLVEIIIIAVFVYYVLVWIQNSKAWVLMRGIIFIALLFMIAAIFQMSTILWLGEKLLSVALIVVVMVFQPELRAALEKIGSNKIIDSLENVFQYKKTTERFNDKTLNDLVKACYEMGAVKTGALIVLEKNIDLSEYVRTGIMLDSILTRQLLINIFEKNTPLHDGAVIVKGDRVVAATCYLPLSDNNNLSKDLGTRHRAAVGMSEQSDALVLVVSEETGLVSIAEKGVLRHAVSADELYDRLKELQQPEKLVADESDSRFLPFGKAGGKNAENIKKTEGEEEVSDEG